jgi:hypothetical protein
MAGILLVHGAWHGPWCWDGFAERLAGHGHQVLAVSLRRPRPAGGPADHPGRAGGAAELVLRFRKHPYRLCRGVVSRARSGYTSTR